MHTYIADLNHLRTVKPEKHKQFAVENEMFSHTVSAKTGDNINRCFHSIAADLAGVVLTKPELEVSSTVMKAEIIDYQKHDPEVPPPQHKKSNGCIVS